MLNRRLWFYLVPLLAGAVLAGFWASLAGGAALVSALRRAHPITVGAMFVLTAGWLFVRFMRWQFLLRCMGIRIPIRQSLTTYIAALPGTVTPAYVGEIARGIFIRRRFGVPLRVTTAVLVIERLYDVMALAIIAAVTAMDAQGLQIGALFGGLAVFVAILFEAFLSRTGFNAEALSRLRAPAAVGPSLLLSLTAWTPAAFLVSFAAAALDVPLIVGTGIHVFASSTLIGALTLLPAGVGATGSAAILQLTKWGLPLATAVVIVSLVRLTSTGAAISVGFVFLWRELVVIRSRGQSKRAGHFDEIAAEYDAQWSSHVWDHLLTRKIDLMTSVVPAPPHAGLGLDCGCGLGVQLNAMTKRGYRVIGLDRSSALLASAHSPGRLLAGDVLALPFQDMTFDFVYAIGILHHVAGQDAQAAAYREIMRVLKPDGIFLVHESNPRNPVFRFYMGYIFPMLRKIDEGTEWWIDPGQPSAPLGLRLEAVHYFTFLPDFTPRALMRPAVVLERRLERSAAGRYSVHYMAVLRRMPEDAESINVRKLRV